MNNPSSSTIGFMGLTFGVIALSYAAPNRPDIFILAILTSIVASFFYAHLELKWSREDQQKSQLLRDEFTKLSRDLQELKSTIKPQ